MRFLPPLPARAARRGLLGAVAGTLVALTSACSFFTGVPDVKRVDVSIATQTVAVGATTQATGTAYGKSDKVLVSSKVVVGFSSGNPTVAIVNPSSGVITGVSEGTAVITAAARGKSDTASITVRPAIPAAVTLTPPNVAVGETVTLDIRAFDGTGLQLTGRRATVTSSAPTILRVNNSGTTTVSVTGIAIGSATLSIDVDGRSPNQVLTVTVTPIRPSAATFRLAKSTNTLGVGETSQATLELRDGTGAVIANNTQNITFTSDDQTVASINPSTGVVTGLRSGTAIIKASIAGTALTPSFAVIVTDIPVRQVVIRNRAQFARVASDGSGVPSARPAEALDSLGRVISGRQITYRSTDNAVFTVNALGTVTGRRIGSRALLIASADNGAAADTVEIRVTEVPILLATITPKVQTIIAGESIQFTTTFTDSLANTVTSNNVDYFTSNSAVLPTTLTGLATGVTSGVATVTVRVMQVSGIPTYTTDQAQVSVLAKQVATLDANPKTTTLKVGTSTNVVISARASDGTQLFGASVVPVPKDPTIVNVTAPTVNGTSTIQGLKEGSTEITYQAVNSSGIAVGTPVTITVTVTAATP